MQKLLPGLLQQVTVALVMLETAGGKAGQNSTSIVWLENNDLKISLSK